MSWWTVTQIVAEGSDTGLAWEQRVWVYLRLRIVDVARRALPVEVELLLTAAQELEEVDMRTRAFVQSRQDAVTLRDGEWSVLNNGLPCALVIGWCHGRAIVTVRNQQPHAVVK